MVDEILFIHILILGKLLLVFIKYHLVNSIVKGQVVGPDSSYQVFAYRYADILCVGITILILFLPFKLNFFLAILKQ